MTVLLGWILAPLNYRSFFNLFISFNTSLGFNTKFPYTFLFFFASICTVCFFFFFFSLKTCIRMITSNDIVVSTFGYPENSLDKEIRTVHFSLTSDFNFRQILRIWIESSHIFTQNYFKMTHQTQLLLVNHFCSPKFQSLPHSSRLPQQ